VPDGGETLGDRFRRLANQFARAWALCSGSQSLDHPQAHAKFHADVRGWMGKFDAQARQAEGKVQRMLSALVASATAPGEIVDIYEAADLPRPEAAASWTTRPLPRPLS
jgi:type I restriction enzyme R subunit